METYGTLYSSSFFSGQLSVFLLVLLFFFLECVSKTHNQEQAFASDVILEIHGPCCVFVFITRK